ncbi:MAG: hypothetical protein OIF57_00870 [Marinobacterium sp.]|nr:hypothetical protein [Marinobacterium sp.]
MEAIFPVVSEYPNIIKVGAVGHLTKRCHDQNGVLKAKRLAGLERLESSGFDVTKAKSIVKNCIEIAENTSVNDKVKERLPSDKEKSAQLNPSKNNDGDLFVYGLILDVQVKNTSVADNNSGYHLGSVVAQAMYIDNSNWRSYSAKSQLGVGIIGALIGSSLNKPEKVSFVLNYYIKTADGDLLKSTRIRHSAEHDPVNSCVRVRKENNTFHLVNFKFCEGI